MSKEQRVFAHWKSFGPRAYPMKVLWPDGFNYEYEFEKRTKEQDNNIWVMLARVHKMKVREVKDIVTAERARRKAERG